MNAAALDLLDLETPTRSGRTDAWAIVLAGGNGRRLSEVAWQRYGYPRPKQFCAFDARGTLLEQTLHRAAPLVPSERMVVVTTRAHHDEARECLAGWPDVLHVEQPRNAETAPGILLPLLHVLARDPDATVVILPSDHHVADDEAFRAGLRAARERVDEDPERIALLGVAPDEIEEGYGWILPGETSGGWSTVRAFREKPPRAEVERLMGEGALVNAFVMVARARALGQLCRETLPAWWAALARGLARQRHLERAYDELPPANFSVEVLEPAGERLRVVPLHDSGWSDIGTPSRLSRALQPTNQEPACASPISAALPPSRPPVAQASQTPPRRCADSTSATSSSWRSSPTAVLARSGS